MKESKEIKELKGKVNSLEINLKQVRIPTEKKNESERKDQQVPKSIKCEECNEKFRRNCDLEVHLDGHTREKEFKCEVCGKGFFLHWRLRKHKELHQTQINQRFCHFYNNSKP